MMGYGDAICFLS